ncbi:glycosyltransferase family 2 protein [Porphyromonas cangingivalis]|uniref:glycosyltransferase family 2 protein n=1 Tax=Porphyromonas cangingivalis TaxID=36874 RepID=UPI0006880006
MIEYIAYVVVGFAVLRLLVSLANFLFRESLPKHPLVTDADEGSVSILIPARNEATNIGNILSDLKQMPDKSIGEIIVFDDQSEDDTAEIVLKHALEDPRLRLIRSSSLPEAGSARATDATIWHKKPRATTYSFSMPMCVYSLHLSIGHSLT